MKNNFRFLALLFIGLLVFQAQAQWVNIGSTPNHTLKSLVFSSNNIAYCIGSYNGHGKNSLLKSTDAGKTWLDLKIDSITFNKSSFIKLQFPTEKIGYLIVRKGIPRTTYFLYKTTDGGVSWKDISPSKIKLGPSDAVLHFVNENLGFLASENELFKTIDGGKTWASKLLATNGYSIKDIDFEDDKHGIVGYWDGTFAYKGKVLTTNDGGDTWLALNFQNNYTNIGKVSYASVKTAFALQEYNFSVGQTLYVTHDNGTTWDSLHLAFLKDSSDNADDFLFVNEKEGYLATRKGRIYKTLNGGVNWSLEHTIKFGLRFIEQSSSTVYAGGPINVLIVNDLNLRVISQEKENKLYFYPNPVSDVLHLKIEGFEFLNYSLINMNGAEIQTGKIGVGISMLNIKNGIYILEVLDGNKVIRKPIIVQH